MIKKEGGNDTIPYAQSVCILWNQLSQFGRILWRKKNLARDSPEIKVFLWIQTQHLQSTGHCWPSAFKAMPLYPEEQHCRARVTQRRKEGRWKHLAKTHPKHSASAWPVVGWFCACTEIVYFSLKNVFVSLFILSEYVISLAAVCHFQNREKWWAGRLRGQEVVVWERDSWQVSPGVWSCRLQVAWAPAAARVAWVRRPPGPEGTLHKSGGFSPPLIYSPVSLFQLALKCLLCPEPALSFASAQC